MTVGNAAAHNKQVLAVDLGKTSCRLRLGDELFEGPGSPGLAERDGVERAAEAIIALVDRIPRHRLHTPTTIAVGAAGAASAPKRARALAVLLTQRAAADAAVTSDVMTAHAGALSGRPGVILIAGTGAVAVALDADGTLRRADGAGIWLGDEGSGRWIGREGLRAAIRADDGRGPSTSLVEAAATEIAPPTDLPMAIGSSDAPERALARFAPVVLAAAARGDSVATAIVSAAVNHLVESVTAVGPAGTRVVALGGLTRSPALAGQLAAALEASGTIPIHADGDALDGAALIAHRSDLPHERQVSRVRRP